MRCRLRTLLIVFFLAPPLIALYIAVGLAARDVARGETQIRKERALLEAERAAFEKERAAQPAAPPTAYAPDAEDRPQSPPTDGRP